MDKSTLLSKVYDITLFGQLPFNYRVEKRNKEYKDWETCAHYSTFFNFAAYPATGALIAGFASNFQPDLMAEVATYSAIYGVLEGLWRNMSTFTPGSVPGTIASGAIKLYDMMFK